MKSKPSLVIFSLLMVLLLSCNLITSTVAGTGGNANSSQPQADLAVTTTPPDLPEPPAAALFDGTPEEQAVSLAQALTSAPDNLSRLAVWLGVYEAAGIPVFDESGAALTDTGDDPVGAPYWSVWYASGMDLPLRGMTLDDAGKILTSMPDGTYDAAAGGILLSDLRQSAQSDDPQARLLALFVRQRMLAGSIGQDMLLAEASPDALRIDPATVQLLHFALARSLLVEIARTEPQSSTTGGRVYASFSLQPAFSPALSKPRCADIFGSEDTTAAVNWLMNKFYNGLSVPGVKGLPGMTETALKQFGVSAGKIERLNTFMQRANAIGMLLSLYMQIHALQVDGEMTKPGPLIRTKKTSDGERGGITWHLYYDKEKIPDGNQLWACMANFISNAFGVTFAVPPSEPVAGADIIFAPGENIPEKVLFDSSNTNYRITTDANGNAELKLIGTRQKKDLPDSSPPYDDTFSMVVSAQIEATTGSSLVNMFMDSLGFVVMPGPAAAVAPLVDLMKTLHYELGEYQFLLTDWRAGYTASGGQGIEIIGTICGGLDAPFHLEGAVPDGSNVTFSYAPSNDKGGSYTYSGSGGGFSFSGSGSYTIAETDSDVLILTQTDTRGCVNTPQGGCKEYTNTVTLTPADSCTP